MSRRRIQPPRASVLLAVGMVLLAANLRPAAAAVGPLHRPDPGRHGPVGDRRRASLTTLPVLCFGALAPLAPALARRLGERTTAALALVVLLAGLLVRLVPGLGFLFFGTALAGAAIAVGNVLLPVLVRGNFAASRRPAHQHVHDRAGRLRGAGRRCSVPVADAFGGGWRPGLAIWAVPAAIALVVVGTPAGPPRRAAPVPAGHPVTGARALLRDPVAWAVTLFFAVQSAGFYATLAWLPSVFHSHGMSTLGGGLPAQPVAGRRPPTRAHRSLPGRRARATSARS